MLFLQGGRVGELASGAMLPIFIGVYSGLGRRPQNPALQGDVKSEDYSPAPGQRPLLHGGLNQMQGGSLPPGAFPSDLGSDVHLPDGMLVGHSEPVTCAESNLPSDPMHPAGWSRGILEETCTTARAEGTQFPAGSLVPFIFIAQSLWKSRKKWVYILPCTLMLCIHPEQEMKPRNYWSCGV